MKKILFPLLTFCALSASAQTEIIVGDMNGDGELSIGDVTVLTDAILKDKEPAKHSCRATAYTSDNGYLVGTWGDGTRSYTFYEDGTSSHGLYVFKPQLGRILFYNDDHQLIDFLLVHELTADKLEMSTRDGYIMNYTRGVAEDYHHDYVDLGLPSGTLWATCNLGADTPYEEGEYFAWGEINGSFHGYTLFDFGQYKYVSCIKVGYDYVYHKYYSGDNLLQLQPEDDAATYYWGSNWRIPSKAQIEELLNTEYVTLSKTSVDGKEVLRIRSNANDNCLYIPASGYYSGTELKYTSKTIYTMWTNEVGSKYYNAKALHYGETNTFNNTASRALGYPIRPVYVGAK